MQNLLIALVISISLHGAPPKKAPKVKPAPVEAVDKLAPIKALSIIPRYQVEEELLLEKCKETPRIYRNALVEMHGKRLAAYRAYHTDFLRLFTQPGVDQAEMADGIKTCKEQIAKYEEAIQKLNDLKFD